VTDPIIQALRTKHQRRAALTKLLAEGPRGAMWSASGRPGWTAALARCRAVRG
jgi:hypothetical protein